MPDARQRVQLGKTGLAISRLGVGGTPFGNLFRPIPEEELTAAFEEAWRKGLRYFDTAPQYGGGLSEIRLGRLLAAKPRGEYVLSTKVGKLLAPTADGRAPDGIFASGLPNEVRYDYSYDGAMRSIEQSLVRSGLDRLDIVLIHDVNRKYHGDRVWDIYAEARAGACVALRKLRDEGVISAFGPANRELDVNLRFASEIDIDCLMLPSRFTLLDRSAEEELLPLCLDRGIGVLVAGAFDSGILATGAMKGATYGYAAADEDVLDRVRRLELICQDLGVQLAAAALQFPLTHPAVVSVVTGMSSRLEVETNIAFMTTQLPSQIWDRLRI